MPLKHKSKKGTFAQAAGGIIAEMDVKCSSNRRSTQVKRTIGLCPQGENHRLRRSPCRTAAGGRPQSHPRPCRATTRGRRPPANSTRREHGRDKPYRLHNCRQSPRTLHRRRRPRTHRLSTTPTLPKTTPPGRAMTPERLRRPAKKPRFSPENKGGGGGEGGKGSRHALRREKDAGAPSSSSRSTRS